MRSSAAWVLQPGRAKRSIGCVRWSKNQKKSIWRPWKTGTASWNMRLGQRVSLVHGRMSADEKDEAMDDFKSGRTRVLVATTVIEVGVDVPDATIIVIEHAERFGLAQLHQLRGRVGRGDKPSSCVLLYKGPLGETAGARLNIMRETNDGFLIAEEDLRLRGGGEILGTRQSGTPGFRIARADEHADFDGSCPRRCTAHS